jgi:hypothetical protein
MTVNPNVTGREHDLEDALRGMCNHLTRIQCRAAEYLPNGDADAFIDDVLGLLDGPDQRRVQSRARELLSEPYEHISLRIPS